MLILFIIKKVIHWPIDCKLICEANECVANNYASHDTDSETYKGKFGTAEIIYNSKLVIITI